MPNLKEQVVFLSSSLLEYLSLIIPLPFGFPFIRLQIIVFPIFSSILSTWDNPPKVLNNSPFPLYRFPLKFPLYIVILSFFINLPFPLKTNLFSLNIDSPS